MSRQAIQFLENYGVSGSCELRTSNSNLVCSPRRMRTPGNDVSINDVQAATTLEKRGVHANNTFLKLLGGRHGLCSGHKPKRIESPARATTQRDPPLTLLRIWDDDSHTLYIKRLLSGSVVEIALEEVSACELTTCFNWRTRSCWSCKGFRVTVKVSWALLTGYPSAMMLYGYFWSVPSPQPRETAVLRLSTWLAWMGWEFPGSAQTLWYSSLEQILILFNSPGLRTISSTDGYPHSALSSLSH